MPALPFPPVEISIKLAIAVGIGMLVGLEREWSQKDLGTRTFAITAMADTLGFRKIKPQTAGIATVLTSMASALSNLPLLHQQVRQWTITRRLSLLSFAIVAAGVLAMLLSSRILPG